VKVYWDTDGDGVADKDIVFCDGLSLRHGRPLGNGGIYVGQAPELYFYPSLTTAPTAPKPASAKQFSTASASTTATSC